MLKQLLCKFVFQHLDEVLKLFASGWVDKWHIGRLLELIVVWDQRHADPVYLVCPGVFWKGLNWLQRVSHRLHHLLLHHWLVLAGFVGSVKPSALQLVRYQMTGHLDFNGAHVRVLRQTDLLFVGFHAALKPVVGRGYLGRHFGLVVVQVLDAFDIVLKAPVLQFSHVDREWQLHLFCVLRKQCEVAWAVVFVLGGEAQFMQRNARLRVDGVEYLAEGNAVRACFDLRIIRLAEVVQPLH